MCYGRVNWNSHELIIISNTISSTMYVQSVYNDNYFNKHNMSKSKHPTLMTNDQRSLIYKNQHAPHTLSRKISLTLLQGMQIIME